MEIKLTERQLPRNPSGDVEFTQLEQCGPEYEIPIGILNVFTPAEIVELVNRACNQLEYQKEAHKKRAKRNREVMKALKAELKAQGKDVEAELTKRQLEGKS